MGLTYTKNGQGQIIKTFTQTLSDVSGEIYVLEQQLKNIKQSNLDKEGNVVREYSAQEQSLINELEQALTILKE